MLEAQEGLDWQKAPMFNHFKNKFPVSSIVLQLKQYPDRLFQDTVAEIEARMARNGAREDPEADYEEDTEPTKSAEASSHYMQQKTRETRQTQPRTPIKGKAEAIEISSNSDDEGEERVVIAGENPRKRKSILQPKGSKYSKKATGRRQSFRTTNAEFDVDQDDDLIMEDASPLATAAPRTTTTSQPSPKKHSSVLDDYASYHEYRPRMRVESRLVSYKLPSTEPQGPGDLWTCTFEGCRQRVHSASTPDGKERIKAHFRAHAESAQAKIDLALQESRPYLPVE